jgi:hypothetical protein
MSALARCALRTAARTTPHARAQTRAYSTVEGASYEARQAAVKAHALGMTDNQVSWSPLTGLQKLQISGARSGVFFLYSSWPLLEYSVQLLCVHSRKYVIYVTLMLPRLKPFDSVIVCSVWVYNAEKEHNAHEAHAKEENGGVRPQPPAYEYLNRRVKPFPWGNNALFYNAEVCFGLIHTWISLMP